MKSVKKSMRSMKAILPVDVSMVRKNKNVVMCALVIMILLAKRLRPLVSNMVGKLAVIVLVCYLAMADLSLGLLGVLFFAAVNNSFIEGFKEGTGAAAGEGDEADDEAKPDPPPEEGAPEEGTVGFTGREGEGDEEEEPAAGGN